MAIETLGLVVQTQGGDAAINVLRGIGVAGAQSGINIERMNVFLKETGPVAKVSGTEATMALQNIGRQAEYANYKLVGISSTMRLMRNVLVGLSFFRVFEGLVQGVNAMQQSVNLLRTVTANGQMASAAFDHFYTLAQATRAPMEDIVKLAVQVSRTIPDGAEKLGKVDSIVKNIAESFAVAGMNGQQTRNVIRDINEMFAGGTVIMRQFRAILQQDRPLLDAIAQTLVATGPKAKEFNDIMERSRKAGALSGGTVTEALHTVPGALLGSDIQRSLEGVTKVQTQFGVTSETIGQALTKMNNSWLEFIKHLSDATNGLNFLAGSVDWIGSHIPLIVALGAALASLLIVNLVTTEFFRFGSVIKDVFAFVFSPVIALAEMLYNVSVSLVSITGRTAEFLAAAPGRILAFSEAMTSLATNTLAAGGAFARLVVQAPANVLNAITRGLMSIASAAGLVVQSVSDFAETAEFTINTAFRDLESVMGSIIQSAGGIGAAFLTMGAQIAASIGGALVEALVNVLPLLISLAAMAVPIVTLGVALYGLVQPLAQVWTEGTKFAHLAQGATDMWVEVPALILATFQTLLSDFHLFTRAFEDLWKDMLNSMKNELGSFGNTAADFLNPSSWLAGAMGVHTQSRIFQTNRPTSEFTKDFDKILAEIKIKLPQAEATMAPIMGKLKQQFFELINGTGEGPAAPPKQAKGYDAAYEGLINLIAKYDALAEVQKTVAATTKVLNEAQAKGIDVNGVLAEFGLTKTKLLDLEARAAIGLGNADFQAANKIKMLSEEQAKYNFVGEDALRIELLKREASESALKTHLDAESGLKLAQLQEADRMADMNKITAAAAKGVIEAAHAGLVYEAQTKAITDALGKSADAGQQALAVQEKLAAFQKYLKDSGLGRTEGGGLMGGLASAADTLNNPGKVFEEQTVAAFKHTTGAAFEYGESVKAVNTLLAMHAISAADAADQINKLGLAYLKTQTDAMSGFQAGAIEVEQTMNDLATNAAKVWPDLFNGFNKALTELIDTGNIANFKNAIHSMAASVIGDLTQMGIKAAIEAPIANMLFGGTGAAQGASALAAPAGLVSSLAAHVFGGAVGSTASLGATAASPLWVAIASNVNDVFGGSTSTSPGGLLGGGLGSVATSGGLLSGAGMSGVGSTIGALGGAANLGSTASALFSGNGGSVPGGYITPSGSFIPAGTGSALSGAAGVVGNTGITGAISSFFSPSTETISMSDLSAYQAPGAAFGPPVDPSAASGFSDMMSGAGDALSSAGDWFSSMFAMLPGFAGGGDFLVGGNGATDSQLVMFRASPDETVSVKRPGERGQEIGGQPQLHMHLHGVSDADSFKRSQSQLTASVHMMAERARMRNGGR